MKICLSPLSRLAFALYQFIVLVVAPTIPIFIYTTFVPNAAESPISSMKNLILCVLLFISIIYTFISYNKTSYSYVKNKDKLLIYQENQLKYTISLDSIAKIKLKKGFSNIKNPLVMEFKSGKELAIPCQTIGLLIIILSLFFSTAGILNVLLLIIPIFWKRIYELNNLANSLSAALNAELCNEFSQIKLSGNAVNILTLISLILLVVSGVSTLTTFLK